jgi:hypothetical protein
MDKSISSELQSLYEERNFIQDKIYKIELKKKIKENSLFVGNYYKYKSCYSYPESEKDYWYIYVYVKSFDEDLEQLNCFSFQTDDKGEIEINPNYNTYNHMVQTKITKKEFNREWKKVKEKISKYEF